MTANEPMGLFGQIQKMQADMQAAQTELANEVIEATVGGGVVKATVNGEGALRARGENVVPGKARRTDPHLHRQALSARPLAPPAAAGDDAVLSRELGLKAVGQ